MTFGFWTSFAVATVVWLLLPWMWWNGGSLELPVDSRSIRPSAGFAYELPLMRVIRHSFRAWTPVRGHDPTSLFFSAVSDSTAVDHRPSKLELYEDGAPLGPGHSSLREIRQVGLGRYSHFSYAVAFSSSDNSNPRTNRRSYTIRRVSQPRLEPFQLAVAAFSWLAGGALLLAVMCRWRRLVDLVRRSGAFSAPALRVLFLTAAFSFYAFSCSRLIRQEAFFYLCLLAACSALFLLLSRQRLLVRKCMLWPAVFLAYGVASTTLGRSPFASRATAADLLLTSLLGVVTISAMYRGLEGRRELGAILVASFCLSFALLVLLQNLGFDFKSVAAGFDRWRLVPWQLTTWNQKYQETWLLMLTWVVVAAVAPLDRRRWVAVSLILTLSALAIFTGYSLSVRLALLISVGVFVCSLLAPLAVRHGMAIAAVALFLSMPLLAGGLWDDFIERPTLLAAERGFAPHATRRAVVWEHSRELIAQQPWLGWGLGASKNLPGRQTAAGEVMAEGSRLPAFHAKRPALPGGHPHSLPLLIWLETGAIGAALAAGFLWTLIRRLETVVGRARHAALLALAASFLFIFGINYPAWDPALQMLIIMTVGLVLAIGRPGPAQPGLDRQAKDSLHSG